MTCDDLRTLTVEAAEQPHRFEHGELLGQLRLLQLDAEPLAEPRRVGGPAEPEHFHVARIRRGQPLADLDGGGLAGAVGAEQPEAFAGADLEVQARDGDHVVIALAQVANAQPAEPAPAAASRQSCRPSIRSSVMRTECRLE